MTLMYYLDFSPSGPSSPALAVLNDEDLEKDDSSRSTSPGLPNDDPTDYPPPGYSPPSSKSSLLPTEHEPETFGEFTSNLSLALSLASFADLYLL